MSSLCLSVPKRFKKKKTLELNPSPAQRFNASKSLKNPDTCTEGTRSDVSQICNCINLQFSGLNAGTLPVSKTQLRGGFKSVAGGSTYVAENQNRRMDATWISGSLSSTSDKTASLLHTELIDYIHIF